jgi:hypothetical protein
MEGSHQLILMGSFLHQSSDIGGFALQGITLRTSETVGKPQALHLLYEEWLRTIPSDQNDLEDGTASQARMIHDGSSRNREGAS